LPARLLKPGPDPRIPAWSSVPFRTRETRGVLCAFTLNRQPAALTRWNPFKFRPWFIQPPSLYIYTWPPPPIHAHYPPFLMLTTHLPNPTNLLGRSKGPLFNVEPSKFQYMVVCRFTGSAVHRRNLTSLSSSERGTSGSTTFRGRQVVYKNATTPTSMTELLSASAAAAQGKGEHAQSTGSLCPPARSSLSPRAWPPSTTELPTLLTIDIMYPDMVDRHFSA